MSGTYRAQGEYDGTQPPHHALAGVVMPGGNMFQRVAGIIMRSWGLAAHRVGSLVRRGWRSARSSGSVTVAGAIGTARRARR